MRTWLSSVLLIVSGAFAFASGCGNPEVVNSGGFDGPDSGSAGNGSGATGGTFTIGDGGTSSNGCPSTCDELNANCGFVTDTKCGDVIQCGTCKTDEVCGGSEPNRCGPGTGTLPDGGTCTASTCDELGAECGNVSDPQCPGTVVDCGQTACPGHCTNGKCTTATCTPTADNATLCANAGLACGVVGDGCDGQVSCGDCTSAEHCQGGVCVPNGCVVQPAFTCAGQHRTCGELANNCGVIEVCGPKTCSVPGQTCGGGAQPGVCGCTGACSQIPTCAPGVTTTLTGKVYDPAGRNPLYRVLVYIANNPADPNLKTFPTGVTCDVCGASAAGSPLVSTPGATDPPAGEYTAVNGTFTLKNVPAGNVTLVIQLGKWRRTFPINVANSCAANTIADKTLLMPATKAQGNIPLMAMVTGEVDSLECVLRKMGIDKSEFTDPAQGGRVQFYAGAGSPGQTIDTATPTQDKLFVVTGGQPVINNYDMTILSCQGQPFDQTAPDQAALRAYADSGGRVFATHFSYKWLDNNKPTPSTANVTDNWNEVAQWHRDTNDDSVTDDASSPTTGIIDKVSNPKGNAFQGWLEAVGASAPGSGTTTVYVVRHDTDFISPVAGRTQQWLYRDGINARKCTYTRNTCTSAASCTPKVCTVATTVACTGNGNCSPRVCSNRPATTCTNDNGCRFGGGNNGTCEDNTCGNNTCDGTDYSGLQTPLHFTFNTPVNLKQDLTKVPPAVQCGRVLFSDFHVADAHEKGETFPAECGKLPTGLTRATGNAAGTCTTNAQCTGKCAANKCPWGTACTADADCASTCSGGICFDPMTAQEKLLEYMIFDLGSCVPPTTTCVPKTTCPAGQDCGYADDGCGGLVACGVCPTGESCGVGQPPVANKCGKVTCTPAGCPASVECGFASDGCSGVANCGTCPTGQTCNAGKCGSTSCSPQSCEAQGLECGQVGDGCGQVSTCPTCPGGQSCVAGMCVPLTCVPKTCDKQGIECGQAGDGCGNMIASCGDCSAGELCIAGQCVPVN